MLERFDLFLKASVCFDWHSYRIDGHKVLLRKLPVYTCQTWHHALSGAPVQSHKLTKQQGLMSGFSAACVCPAAASTHPLGMEGWRFAFLMVALVSLSIGGLTLAFAKDPRSHSSASVEAESAAKPRTDAILSDLLTILRLPTFVIIVLQVNLPSTSSCLLS